MRRPVLFLLLIYCSRVHAQLPSLRAPHQISPVLSQVIADYPDYLEHLRGDLIASAPESTCYLSLLSIEGMEPGVITQYGQEKEQLYTWSNVLLETDDFGEAKKKFRSFYSDIKRTTAEFHHFSVRLLGDYQEPEEDKKFTTVIFHLETIEKTLKDVVVELSMQYEMSDWKISMSVYRLMKDQYASQQGEDY